MIGKSLQTCEKKFLGFNIVTYAKLVKSEKIYSITWPGLWQGRGNAKNGAEVNRKIWAKRKNRLCKVNGGLFDSFNSPCVANDADGNIYERISRRNRGKQADRASRKTCDVVAYINLNINNGLYRWSMISSSEI